MDRLFFVILLLLCLQSRSQKILYSTANAHSHNDYEQAVPFWNAWKNRFGSIEADIFLHNGKLIVAHDSTQLARSWTLDSLYLRPLEQCIKSNNGKVYPDGERSLQLMIDIKSYAVTTLNHLIEKIKVYPFLITAKNLKIVISGNRPEAATFSSYPQWIMFDGDLRKEYTADQLERIEMLSGNFKNYSSWNGVGKMIRKEKAAVKSLIQKAHNHRKKIRFWNAPDNQNSWNVFMKEGVDFINTDRIGDISYFFNHLQ